MGGAKLHLDEKHLDGRAEREFLRMMAPGWALWAGMAALLAAGESLFARSLSVKVRCFAINVTTHGSKDHFIQKRREKRKDEVNATVNKTPV